MPHKCKCRRKCQLSTPKCPSDAAATFQTPPGADSFVVYWDAVAYFFILKLEKIFLLWANGGEISGGAFAFTFNGLRVLKTGRYGVHLSAVLEGLVPDGLILVFAVVNGQLQPGQTNGIIGVNNTLAAGEFVQFEGYRVLPLKKNDTLSLIIMNGGGPNTSVRLYAWGVSAQLLAVNCD